MAFIDYFSSNHGALFFAIAGVSLVLELAVMGLSGLLLFFSIGCLTTAILSQAGVITGWESEIFSVGVFSVAAAVLLWKPLKLFQSRDIPVDNSSDLIGRIVMAINTINSCEGSIKYSGVSWQARIDPLADTTEIDEGSTCKITKIEGTLLFVDKVNSE
jgi:membrane protein implicated in regulation of membrane protease activity